MKEITLIGELALWARRKRDQGATFEVWLSHFAEIEDPEPEGPTKSIKPNMAVEPGSSTSQHASFIGGETLDYEKLLEDWDEPHDDDGYVGISSCAVSFMLIGFL